MLRRSFLELSARRGGARIPRQIAAQRISRNEFSAKVQKTPAPAAKAAGGNPGGPGKPPAESGSRSGVVLFGGAALAAGIGLAYQTGYLDRILGRKEEAEIGGGGEVKIVEEEDGSGGGEVKIAEEEGVKLVEGEEDGSGGKLSFEPVLSEEKSEGSDSGESKSQAEEDEPVVSHETAAKEDVNVGVVPQENVDEKSTEEEASQVTKEEAPASPVFDHKESELEPLPTQQEVVEDKAEDAVATVEEPPSSLLSAYNLKDEAGGLTGTDSSTQGSAETSPKENEALINAVEELDAAYISKDGKLVLDFIQTIQAAQTMQAELDAHVFADEKRAIKEKYEKKLKDAGIREMMLAEEAAMLDKELKRERAKAVAALKSLQEKLEEKFKADLEQKENEAERKLKEVEGLAKAQLAAAIASEKASQIEKMTEANLHINALCVAFYARSEEARQTHSAHKLALGALALEDALSRGLPIQTEIEALNTYLEGIDKNSILGLVLSSLPEETRKTGTDTLLQLNQKFHALKGTVRHFSLIPPGGGGILTHSLARIASWLKVKEVDHSGDGIESVIHKVECYLAEGKIAEAAEALEEGVKGTQATEVIGDWVKRARSRAITEQALTLLESYATSISIT